MSNDDRKTSFMNNLRKQGEEAKIVRKIVFIIIVALTILMISGGIIGYLYIKNALEPVDPDSEEQIEVEIPLGSSASAIANILEENGVIKNGLIFRFYIKLNNITDFQAGNYVFTKSMHLDEIIENLQTGKLLLEPIYTVTIPEGLTIEQIAERFAEVLPFSKEEFLEVVNDEEYIRQLMQMFPTILTEDILDEDIITPLEGYLFAATYDFYEESPTIQSVVEEMLRQTELVVTPYMEAIDEKGLTIHEAITFASIVEKETGHKDQRDQIAGVFYNRLEEGMPLQTDPTVAYALGMHLEKTLIEHTETESPYNTYYIEGLPVGPIANIAKSSLEAVVNPAESDYLYFLHDKDGNIHFAKTYEEHMENHKRYIK